MSHHGGKGAILVGNQLAAQPDPGFAIKGGRVVEVERVTPQDPRDSGFVLYLDSAPDSNIGEKDCVIVCLHCLLEVHPEAAPGLDLAKSHPRVEFWNGRWRVYEGRGVFPRDEAEHRIKYQGDGCARETYERWFLLKLLDEDLDLELGCAAGFCSFVHLWRR